MMCLVMILSCENTVLEATLTGDSLFKFSGSNRQPHEPVIFMFKKHLDIEVVYDPEQFNAPLFSFFKAVYTFEKR